MKDDGLYLIHILECIARIEKYTVNGRREFMSSELVQDAVIRNLQVLAESSQRLSDDVKIAHPEIDWKGVSGFRNVLVHGYLGVDIARCWEIVEVELPKLKTALSSIMG